MVDQEALTEEHFDKMRQERIENLRDEYNSRLDDLYDDVEEDD